MHSFPPSISLLYSTITAAMLLASQSGYTATYRPSANGQAYGAVTHGQGTINNSSNPSTGAFSRTLIKSDNILVGGLSIDGGIEYGDVEDLFAQIDKLSEALSGIGDGSDGEDGGDGGDDLFDIENPELDALFDALKDEVATLSTLMALVATEGYAAGDASATLSVIINHDILGGTVSINAISRVSTGALGIADEFVIDWDTALSELKDAFNLLLGDPITQFDLTGGITLTIDPTQGRVAARFENDSLLMTRAAQLNELTIGYSRPLGHFDNGNLYWGVTPKLLNMGLANVTTRIGDITNSKELFEQIDNAEFTYKNTFGLDAGVLWTTPTYSVGASLLDITESKFDFPAVDISSYTSKSIIRQIEGKSEYKLGRQLKLEGGLYTKNRKWSFNAAVDANSVTDILGQEYQWASISTGYKSNNWIVPNVRMGVHSNFAGSKLTYAAMGLTMFKYVNLDLTSTLDTVRLDNHNLRRGLYFALGFNFGF